jgi:hypothetical protein
MRIGCPIGVLAWLAIISCANAPPPGELEPRFRTDTTPGLFAKGSRLEVTFPAVAIERIGCPADSGRRLYYWMAGARYPESRYPNNHFQQVRAWFNLPESIAVGSARFDSAIARQEIVVDEAGGEPPMRMSVVSVDRARLITERVNDNRGLRVRIVVEGEKATRSLVATRDSVVMLGWCDSSKPYQYIMAPFRR